MQMSSWFHGSPKTLQQGCFLFTGLKIIGLCGTVTLPLHMMRTYYNKTFAQRDMELFKITEERGYSGGL